MLEGSVPSPPPPALAPSAGGPQPPEGRACAPGRGAEPGRPRARRGGSGKGGGSSAAARSNGAPWRLAAARTVPVPNGALGVLCPLYPPEVLCPCACPLPGVLVALPVSRACASPGSCAHVAPRGCPVSVSSPGILCHCASLAGSCASIFPGPGSVLCPCSCRRPMPVCLMLVSLCTPAVSCAHLGGIRVPMCPWCPVPVAVLCLHAPPGCPSVYGPQACPCPRVPPGVRVTTHNLGLSLSPYSPWVSLSPHAPLDCPCPHVLQAVPVLVTPWDCPCPCGPPELSLSSWTPLGSPSPHRPPSAGQCLGTSQTFSRRSCFLVAFPPGAHSWALVSCVTCCPIC